MIKPRYRQAPRYPQQGSVGRGSAGQPPEQPPVPLTELMGQLSHLEERLHQLQAGVGNLMQLQQLQETTSGQEAQQAQAEVARLQTAIADFEVELASQVLSWQHLKEPFWQAVRFGGLGVLVGWGLGWLVYGG
jgi:hypothetical protein